MVQRRRHLAKALTWRISSTFVTGVIAWILTKDIAVSSAIMSVDAVIKLILYYGHERIWYKVKWGVKEKENV